MHYRLKKLGRGISSAYFQLFYGDNKVTKYQEGGDVMSVEEEARKEVSERPSNEVIIERLRLGGFSLKKTEERAYLKKEDDLGPFITGMIMPDGYKKCGGCQHVMKFYLFNKNSASKTNTTGNCKACQKVSAAKSYEKTKSRRDYKKYYDANKERKQEHSRKYYQTHKEELATKHAAYHGSAKGKEVMHRAHAKRRNLMAANQGIPYTREDVIDRDKQGKEFPICYFCGKPIKDLSGVTLHIDHVIPVAVEGKDCFTNVACMHDKCNLIKKKDASDITAIMITQVRKLAEQYIDVHPEKFGLDDK